MEPLFALLEFYRTALVEIPAWCFAAVVFLVAGMVGSFLNVCIWRIPRGQSIVTPRSRCVHCGHELWFADLVPVISWALAGGRCRYCRAPVSLRYQVVELTNISLWWLAWALFGRSWTMLGAAVLASAVLGTMGVLWMSARMPSTPPPDLAEAAVAEPASGGEEP